MFDLLATARASSRSICGQATGITIVAEVVDDTPRYARGAGSQCIVMAA